MDIQGLITILKQIEKGEIKVHCKDLSGPSPLSQEIINARPYAFLDDAPAEERRTMAIRSKDYSNPGDASELAQLDPAAIDKVCAQAWPLARNADELYDALVLLAFVNETEVEQAQLYHPQNSDWPILFDELCKQNRAAVCTTLQGNKLWVSAERIPEFRVLFPDAIIKPDITLISLPATPENRSVAIKEIIRSRLECLGPVSAIQLAESLSISEAEINLALLSLEQEGFVVRGRFKQSTTAEEQWCERHLLARIHRYTIKQLRSEIEPVSTADFMRFLFHWQCLTDKG
jgi:ATP-dependent Lhr-like helicase